MKVKTTTRFTDLKENKVREVEDVFEVSKERFEQVKPYVVEVKEVKKEVKPKKEK